MKIITIHSSPDQFFDTYTSIVFKPVKGLSPTEVSVFSELLRQNWTYHHIPMTERNIFIFRTENKKIIRDKLKLSKGTFYNIMASLRKKELITYDTIRSQYLVTPEDGCKIGFHIKLKDVNADN